MPTDDQSRARFGIDARRVARRLDAVIEVGNSPRIALDATDRDLVAQAAGVRRGS